MRNALLPVILISLATSACVRETNLLPVRNVDSRLFLGKWKLVAIQNDKREWEDVNPGDPRNHILNVIDHRKAELITANQKIMGSYEGLGCVAWFSIRLYHFEDKNLEWQHFITNSRDNNGNILFSSFDVITHKDVNGIEGYYKYRYSKIE